MKPTEQEIHVVRDADGHPFEGTRDGVEYVYGVAVDQELFNTLIYMKACFKSLHHLSRPRNAMDTTDEWLAIFCDLEKQMREVRTLLGDQSDLYDGWGDASPEPDLGPANENTLRCEECNGTKVHVAVWVNANTNERFDDAALDPWCEDCEEHVALVHDLGPTHYNCCHAPKDMGHMFGCPNSTENKGGE